MTRLTPTTRSARFGVIALVVALGAGLAAPAFAQSGARPLTIRKVPPHYTPLDVNFSAPAIAGQQRSWARDSLLGNPAWQYNDFMRGPLPTANFSGQGRPLFVF